MKFITAASLAGVVSVLALSLSAQTRDAEPLIEAIRQNDRAAASRAIGAGANPNAKNANGVPALMLATLYADAALVEALLKLGADPNQADSGGATALMWAIPDRQMARVLLDHGANVNARSTSLGRTPLLIAAASPGSVDLLELLLARGANLRAKDTAGYSPLAMAMRSADVEVLRWLTAKGLDLKNEVPAISTSATYARARPSLVEYAMKEGVKPPKDVLIRGSNWQDAGLIRRWIAQGADVNARGGPYNQTPLLTAASSELAGAETLRVLLAHGADPNVPDSEGEKPLDWAIYRSDAARIAILEKHGATRGDGPRRQPLAPPPPGGRPVDARVAVEKGVTLLLKSAPAMFEQRRCFTCHHNAVPAEAAALARKKGIPVPEDLAARNLADILAVFKQAAMPPCRRNRPFPEPSR